MKRLLLALPLALAGTLLVSSPAQADDRRCTRSIGAVSVDGNVIVPQGATCALRGTRVDGNVLVKRGAKVIARGVKVNGNVQGENHLNVVVTPRKVGDRMVRSRIGGDIQLFAGRHAHVRQTGIGGNLQAFSNRGDIRIFANVIEGNLQCKSNVPAPYGGKNRVHGNKEDQCRRL